MGTRHYQKVINQKGEVKIAQYGQWDGYPSGQGVKILDFLRVANLNEYQKNLDKIPQITDKQRKEVAIDENWVEKYPYLLRHCGSDIHKMIEKGDVKFVAHYPEEEAEIWCEGFYTIDFSTNEFTSEYYDRKKSYKLNDLPTEDQYLKDMRDE